MPHITLSLRDPEGVLERIVHKIGVLTFIGMVFAFTAQMRQPQCCSQTHLRKPNQCN